jgi:hypothetical protein
MKRITPLFLVIALAIFAFSCKKQKQSPDQGQGQLEVNFSLNSLKNAKTDTIQETTLSAIVVTIEDLDGNVVKNSEKIDLYNMNGNYISKPLALPKGNYKLTGFLVIDWQNNVVYASPLKGSSKAYLVTIPLPVSFGIQTNAVTKLAPEVLNAASCTPEEFGYSTFTFNVAGTFDFMVGAFVYNDTIKNFKLTSSTISIYTDTVAVYSGQTSDDTSSALVSVYDSIGITNTITLPERYNYYKLIISKPGYKSYSQTFTKEELKLHFRSIDKGPLVVILDKDNLNDGLVAYYKFNGDVKDYSGNNNDGTYYGRGVYNTGYKSDASGAIDLNGSSDYVFVNNSTSLSPTKQITISAWYYSVSFYGNGANSIVCKENIISPPASLYHLAVQGDQYYGSPIFLFNVTTTQGSKAINTDGIFNYAINQWYFIVGEYDGNKTKIYVNGNLIVSASQSGDILNNENNIYIGNTEGLSRPSYDFLAGRVDEVRIYNRALTDDEILSLYQQ